MLKNIFLHHVLIEGQHLFLQSLWASVTAEKIYHVATVLLDYPLLTAEVTFIGQRK